MIRIEPCEDLDVVTLALSGRIQAEDLLELKRVMESYSQPVVLNLAGVKLVDRVTVGFLAEFESHNGRITNCPSCGSVGRPRAAGENQLSVLLGHRPMSIPRGIALTDQIMPPEVPPGLPSDLLQRRPDILVAEQELAAAYANIGVAQAQRFPTLWFTGRAGVFAIQLTGVAGQGPFGTFAALGSLSAPLFNATALGFQVKANEARTRQALASSQRTILSAFQDVENALIAVQKSREKRAAQEQQVEALQSALTFATQRYQGGGRAISAC